MTNADPIDPGVRPGDVLADKYRVERVLGAGGMGVVVAAHHIHLDTKVAIKFLLPHMLHDQEAVNRFTREARAAVKITNEHVARVHDVGTLQTGAPYMVMEYLEGKDLSAVLCEQGSLPVEQAVEFVLQACVAVADAHALGIVHRDLKPANLFCVRRSDGQLTIKVLDFGISKNSAGDGTGMSVTKTSTILGSPLYMSPEQMRSSKDVDSQTDIWALGVILFELLSGRPAFLADTVTELAIRIASEPAPLLRSLREDLPIAVEQIVSRCLEKDRRQRYRTVAELAVELLPLAPPRARTLVERIWGILQVPSVSARAHTMAVPPGHSSSMPPAPPAPSGVPTGSQGLAPGIPAPPAAPPMPPHSIQTSAAHAGSTTTHPVAAAQTGGRTKRSPAAVMIGAACACVVVIVGAGYVVHARGDRALGGSAPLETPSAAATATAVVNSAGLPSAQLPPPQEPPPVASAAQSAPPPVPSPSPAPRHVGHGTKPTAEVSPAAVVPPPQPTAVPAPVVETPKPPPKRSDCDPPYTFDADGNKIFKVGCYK